MARKTWIGLLSDFVRKNPRTSAMIAFNLGVWAAQATRRGLRDVDVGDLPAKVAGLMPSMKDLGSYMPSLPSPKTRATAKVTRRPRKSSTRSRSRTTRSSRRRSSKSVSKSEGKRRAA